MQALKPMLVTEPPQEHGRYEQLLTSGEALRQDVGSFVASLMTSLPAPDAAYVRTLHRLHSTGQFLGQLEDWVAAQPHRPGWSDQQQMELTSLMDRWSTLRRQIVTLFRDGQESIREME